MEPSTSCSVFSPGCFLRRLLPAAFALLAATTPAFAQSDYTILAWNDLGMHCMDNDFSVFSILPPYNTIHAQLIDPQGNLVLNPNGIVLTYSAVADPNSSINAFATGKTNFWDYSLPLFGATLAPELGLAGFSMPGPQNTPQPMTHEPAHQWFTAEGIPLTPYDDNLAPNPYPLMRITALSNTGQAIASSDIVLPVSDEMDCRLCHSSGEGPAARPSAGWENHLNPDLDPRWNILRLHDELQGGTPTFQNALAKAGYNANGLYATAKAGTPVLCAHCHGSNALPGTGIAGISPLTQVMHAFHANVEDPINGLTLGQSDNRAACYRCHPGEETRCLRGAMGNAIAPDGSFAMQCQSCHGSMTTVGDPGRAGWFEEPTCQSCHTGSATQNNGQIRYLTSFEPNGQPRQAVSNLFATNPNTPAPGVSLYRFSTGHSNLQCSACHGSTHAEFPSHEPNDNLRNIALQGNAGVLAECTACHAESPQTTTGGPHGMHPIGQPWVNDHPDAAEHGGTAACRACHGTDYRGTVLSRALVTRTINTKFGSRTYWKGRQIGCYDCHNGPSDDDANPNSPPTVPPRNVETPAGIPLPIALTGQDANQNPLTFRIVNQPRHGRVALAGNQATFFPDTGFTGTDSFQYAASDNASDSNLGTVTVTVNSIDTDQDGMPDWWEQLHFNSPTAAQPTANPDGDRGNNLEEFIAGTDPNKASSLFRIIQGNQSPTHASIGIVTAPGKTYRLDRSNDLQNWTPIRPGIPGRKGVFPTSDPQGLPPGSTFYRAVVTP